MAKADTQKKKKVTGRGRAGSVAGRSPQAAKKKTPGKKIKVGYQLADLPSSQHRCGLAGLVLMIRWLERKKTRRGVAKVIELRADGARFELDEAGVAELFDEVYGARLEERQSATKWKGAKPLRTEKRKVERDGKTREEKVFVYHQVVPTGAWLEDFDPSPKKLWVKLWRDVVWTILRGVPAQRRPFENRAGGKKGKSADSADAKKGQAKDAEDAWNAIAAEDASQSPVKLASTHYLGAMAETAEAVPFRDTARLQFLLHFWPFVVQVYVPTMLERSGQAADQGYALAFPDIGDLETFCGRFEQVMKQREGEAEGYRPRGGRIEVPAEGGLEILARLRESIGERAGAQATGDVVVGVDIFHAHKPGNAVKILGTARVTPDAPMLDAYEQIRGAYFDRAFRRRRLVNLLAGEPWWRGFERIMSVIDADHFVQSGWFGRDVRKAFEEEGFSMNEEGKPGDRPVEKLVYDFVRGYVTGRLRSKYGLEWSEEIKGTGKESEYGENRSKLAREAFLAVRSRTGADFVEYFTTTLCSTAQFLPEGDFMNLARELHTDSDKIRTLTLLALSAQGYRATKQEGKNNDG